MSINNERVAELDMAEAAAEYFNVDIRLWAEEQKVSAGRYLLKEAALRTHNETPATPPD